MTYTKDKKNERYIKPERMIKLKLNSVVGRGFIEIDGEVVHLSISVKDEVLVANFCHQSHEVVSFSLSQITLGDANVHVICGWYQLPAMFMSLNKWFSDDIRDVYRTYNSCTHNNKSTFTFAQSHSTHDETTTFTVCKSCSAIIHQVTTFDDGEEVSEKTQVIKANNAVYEYSNVKIIKGVDNYELLIDPVLYNCFDDADRTEVNKILKQFKTVEQAKEMARQVQSIFNPYADIA